MATEAIKAAAITNLDATPPVRTTHYGQKDETLFGSVAVTTAKDNGSTYQMARLPSHAKLHSMQVWLDAAVTTFTGDITSYYSDATGPAIDGTSLTNIGAGAVAAHVYKTAYAMASVVAPAEVYMGGNITGANLGKTLWQDAGLSSDPGGFFDIVILTTTTNSGTGRVNLSVRYGFS